MHGWRMVMVASLLWISAADALAGSTSPGKKSVFVSETGKALPLGSVTLLSGTIAKGKRKRVLTVHAMITNGPYANPQLPVPVALSLNPLVNGVPMEPTTENTQGAVADCGAFTEPRVTCTLTGTWWLDLDAAELAHVGTFIGKPLTIELTGGSLAGGGGTPVDVSFSARLEAK
jgi:hypothetical protein